MIKVFRGKGEYTSESIQSLCDNSIHSLNGSFIDILLLWVWRRCKLSCRRHPCRISQLPRLHELSQLPSCQSSQIILLTPTVPLIPQRGLRTFPSSGFGVLFMYMNGTEWATLEKTDYSRRRRDVGDMLWGVKWLTRGFGPRPA